MGGQPMKLNSQARCKPSIIADIDRSRVGHFLKIANKRNLVRLLKLTQAGG